MSVDAVPGPSGGLAFLAREVGIRRLAAVGALLLLASLSEGFGLLLLVPIVQVVAGEAPVGLSASWAAALARVPLAALLAGFVALIALRAGLMAAVLDRRSALSLGLTRRLRTRAHRAIMAADWRWLSGQHSTDHGALIMGQCDRIGREANRALDLATCLVTLVALLGAALWLAWQLTLATAVLGAGTAIVWTALRRREDDLGAPYAAAYRALQRHVGEGLSHLRAARIAGAQAVLERDFSAAAGSLARIERRYTAIGDRANLTLQVIAAAMLALLAWFGLRVLAMPLALFVPVLAIFARIVPLLGAVQQARRAWRFCRPALEDLRQTIAAAEAHAEPVAPAGPPIPFVREIAIDAVAVGFPGRAGRVLDGFSLAIPTGSVIAVTGPSGSGKSTLADLLSGLAAPDSGTIRIDGAPLEGEQRIRWRRQVAYVEQSPYLFDGTIGENLAWGLDDPAPPAMEQALRDASAEFVLALPDGMETRVGEVGRQLSGGERQRVALARALLRKPDLIILDEVTAALDLANEAAIAATIERRRGETTFVILGHRPALHALANRVVRLGDGG
jgi:ATP-binding cassette subfamily C protein